MTSSECARETGSDGNGRARNQETSGAERGRKLFGADEIGKRRRAPEEAAMADGTARSTEAIGAPRRAADQPKGSPGGKAATPERSRIKNPQGGLETGAARRSGGWWQHRPPFSFWASFSVSAFLTFPKNTPNQWAVGRHAVRSNLVMLNLFQHPFRGERSAHGLMDPETSPS